MNLDSLNKWLTLAANLGVIAGIIFLAIEVQQNTRMMSAQTRDAMTERLTNWQLAISTDQYAASIYIRGSNGQELDVANGERLSFLLMVNANLRIWENEWYQFQIGLYDETEFAPRLERWGRTMASTGYRQAWQIFRGQFSPGFREEIDSVVGFDGIDE